MATQDPIGRPVAASYYVSEDCAYIELAEASGIWRLAPDELSVMTTTTIGTGILIKHAIAAGYSKIVLFLGGSCTTDAGLGILTEIGFTFQNKSGQSIIPVGGNLLDITTIIPPSDLPKLSIQILCDVTNPLYGSKGAAHVYGKQKGASPKQIITLDNGLRHISNLIENISGKEDDKMEGAGAAGGILAGLYGLLETVSVSNGFDYLSQLLNLEEKVMVADIVISGEGKLDQSSLDGKVVSKVAAFCRKHGKPFIAIVGQSVLSQKELVNAGMQRCYSVLSLADSVDDALQNGPRYLEEIGCQVRFLKKQ